VFRIKYEEIFSYKPNADTSHLLDSLVSALAVYATAFRSKLSLLSPLYGTIFLESSRKTVDTAIVCSFCTLSCTARTLTPFCRIMKKSLTAIYGSTSRGACPLLKPGLPSFASQQARRASAPVCFSSEKYTRYTVVSSWSL